MGGSTRPREGVFPAVGRRWTFLALIVLLAAVWQPHRAGSKRQEVKATYRNFYERIRRTNSTLLGSRRKKNFTSAFPDAAIDTPEDSLRGLPNLSVSTVSTQPSLRSIRPRSALDDVADEAAEEWLRGEADEAREAYAEENRLRATASRPEWWWHALLALGEGFGLWIQDGRSTTPTGKYFNFVTTMQNNCVMLVGLAAYFICLLLCISVAYQKSKNNSPVTFFAGFLEMEGHDVATFVDTFGESPVVNSLQVMGISVSTYGGFFRRRVAFSFDLDLSRWTVPHEDFMSSEDARTLADYMEAEDEPLNVLSITKTCSWENWEELAFNVKQTIKQKGFGGHVIVRRNCSEPLEVHKNEHWSNFMHSPRFKTAVAFSLVGWLWYCPYMWWRCRQTCVKMNYVVSVEIKEFWSFVEHSFSERGFRTE